MHHNLGHVPFCPVMIASSGSLTQGPARGYPGLQQMMHSQKNDYNSRTQIPKEKQREQIDYVHRMSKQFFMKPSHPDVLPKRRASGTAESAFSSLSANGL
jgi:hypothetical protein